jgi:putative FmdB family regulatory protein
MFVAVSEGGVLVPLYEYKCMKCGQQTEKIEKYDGPRLKKCPKCGGKVEPMVSSPSFQFKGSGWYVTDYARKSSSDADRSEKSDSSAAADNSGTSEAKESKDTKDAKEVKTKDTRAKDTKESTSTKDSRKSTASKK